MAEAVNTMEMIQITKDSTIKLKNTRREQP